MACEEWLERISAHADGELSMAEVSAVTEHLQACEACRHQVETFREDTQRAIKALTILSATPDFAERVMAALPESYAARASWRERLASLFAWRPKFTTGLVQAGAGFAMLAVLLAIMFPPFGKARKKSRQSQCMSNIKNVGLAIRMYVSDNNDRLPPLEGWVDRLSPYIKNNQVLLCPNWAHFSNEPPKSSYALSPAVAGKLEAEIADTANTVMLYEADANGQPNWMAHSGAPPGDILTVGFADGHTKIINRRDGFKLDAEFSNHPQRSRENATKAGRKVSYAGKADVEVARAKAALIRAEQVVEDGGGFLLKSELRRHDAKRFEADLSAKVPAESFFAVINKLCDIGATHYRLVEGEDLTLNYATAQTSVERQRTSVRELGQLFQRSAAAPRPLREGSETPHTLEVQKSLQTTRDVEGQKRHELRAVQTKLVLASITLTISEPEPRESERRWTATGALRDAFTSLRGMGQAVATVGIWFLVYAPVWLPTAIIVWLIVRRTKRASLAA